MIGHNERIAWGFTTTTADVEDLFVEKIDPADPAAMTPQGSAPFGPGRKRSPCKARQPRRSRSAKPGMARCCRTPCRPGQPIGAMSWPGRDFLRRRPHRRGNVGHQPSRQLGRISRGDAANSSDRCRTWSTPMRTARSASSPRGGSRSARKGKGWIPAPGWTGEYDWTGLIPFEALPSASNPLRVISSAPTTRSCPTATPISWPRLGMPNRAERIEALLAATPVQSPKPAPRSRPTRCR